MNVEILFLLVLPAMVAFVVEVAIVLASEGNYGVNAFLGTASFIIVAVIIFAITLSMPIKVEKEPYAIEKIVSLQDNNLTQGKGGRYSLCINTGLYYEYMVDCGSNKYKANKVDASRTDVIFDGSNPRVEWYKRTRKFLFFYTDAEDVYKIYLPVGGMTTNYSIDLQ